MRHYFKMTPMLSVLFCLAFSPCDPESEGLGTKPDVPDGDESCEYYCEDLDEDGHGGGDCDYYNCAIDHDDEGTMDSPPEGYAPYGDCNDGDPDINPDAIEVCDGVDNDCTNGTDIGAVDARTLRYDHDGDDICDEVIEACPDVMPPSDDCAIPGISPKIGR